MFLILANGVQPCGNFDKSEDASEAVKALRESQPEVSFTVLQQVDPAPEKAPE